jgi:thiol-disulfide isomerase/thioredoxin
MNKKVLVIVSIVVGSFLVGGGVFAYTNSQNDKKEQEKMAMEKKTEDEAMMKKDEAAAMEKDKMAKEGDAMSKEDAMSKHGSYITLADYDKDPSKYADSRKVYFFHASWCPICQGIDKEINADMSKIPAGVTMIKTDFDNSTDLRQKYGVTTQYTFVQVDNNGNETAQWSATSLAKAIDGIES